MGVFLTRIIAIPSDNRTDYHDILTGNTKEGNNTVAGADTNGHTAISVL